MFGNFPSEAEPDGAVFGPHHFYLGVLLILMVCWILYADSDSEAGPWVVAGATLLSVFAFALTWPYYPIVGALGVLVLLGAATAMSVLRPFWWRTTLLARSALLLGLLVAWDDALSHALGWQTPLDLLWAEHLHPYVSDPYVPEDVRLPPDLEAFLAEQVGRALAVVPL